jgi:hypothetical protein
MKDSTTMHFEHLAIDDVKRELEDVKDSYPRRSRAKALAIKLLGDVSKA